MNPASGAAGIQNRDMWLESLWDKLKFKFDEKYNNSSLIDLILQTNQCMSCAT